MKYFLINILNNTSHFSLSKYKRIGIYWICSDQKYNVFWVHVLAPHSSTFAWKIPWKEEPGRLQSMWSLESDTTEQLHFHFSFSCTGEGNGNPLQCSCLENPRDGEAWWAAFCGTAQGQTRLRRLSSSSPTRSNSRDCSLPSSSVHGDSPGRNLQEWVAMPSFMGSSQPRDWTQVSHIAGRFFTVWATREVCLLGWD